MKQGDWNLKQTQNEPLILSEQESAQNDLERLKIKFNFFNSQHKQLLQKQQMQVKQQAENEHKLHNKYDEVADSVRKYNFFDIHKTQNSKNESPPKEQQRQQFYTNNTNENNQNKSNNQNNQDDYYNLDENLSIHEKSSRIYSEKNNIMMNIDNLLNQNQNLNQQSYRNSNRQNNNNNKSALNCHSSRQSPYQQDNNTHEDYDQEATEQIISDTNSKGKAENSRILEAIKNFTEASCVSVESRPSKPKHSNYISN